jgi:hypothetical protein
LGLLVAGFPEKLNDESASDQNAHDRGNPDHQHCNCHCSIEVRGGTGPAHIEELPGKQGFVESSAAKSAALSTDAMQCAALLSDANLSKIVAAWPTLPEPLKRAMLALIG